MIYIIYDRERYAKNRVFADMLTEYCKKYGETAETVLVEEFPYDRHLPHLAIMRAVAPDLGAYLTSHGVRVANPTAAANLFNDKYSTYRYLESHNIPLLPYRLIQSDENKPSLRDDEGIVPYNNKQLTHADGSNERLSRRGRCPHRPAQNTESTLNYGSNEFPQVFKSCDGHGGSEVFWVTDEADIRAAFQKTQKTTAILQAPASDTGKDVRTYVIGKKIICSVMRSSTSDFRSNYSLGGRAAAYCLSDEERKKVEEIISLFDFDFVGIDFIYDRGKPVVSEIEDVVGCRTVYRTAGIDLAETYIKYLIGS
ncbi:MAG: hypothetical protein LBT20_00270 [Clostridiales bacterium]|jgi:glutathione synthase/RimK-type ligase-like ATP-grasp enzyme|nr:hypothetical protein [Clostridiales bacterium]